MKSPLGKLPQIRFSELPNSAWVLIGANVLPLLGVIFFGWRTFDIVFIYWLENVMLGAINLLKMATCAPDADLLQQTNFKDGELGGETKAVIDRFKGQEGSLKVAHHAAKLFFMPFFAVHYGMFCFVHGVFVFALLSDAGPFDEGGSNFGFDPFEKMTSIPQTVTEGHLWWAVLALGASHLYSFFRNYLGRGEYRRTILPVLMFQPYGRIVILHVALLFGAFVIMTFGSPVLLLLILIVGKTILDLKLHLQEHQQSEQTDVASGGVA